MPAVTQQPTANLPVTIRNVTVDDAAFVCRLQVEAFRSKMEHAVGKSKVSSLIELFTKDFKCSQCAYHRMFLAEYDGRCAGVVKMDFHDDSETWTGDGSGVGEYCSGLGCCGVCGLGCMACVESMRSIKRGDCYIDFICVDDGFRGKGIGKILLDRVEFEATNRNCSVISLEVADGNRARNLYERQGFVATRVKSSCLTSCSMGIRTFIRMEKQLPSEQPAIKAG